jgi:hypothetical protein
MVYCFVSIAVAVVAFFGWKVTARNAYESAEYTVVESTSSFELREYPDLMMATTGTRFESQGDDGSFMRLFRYISGENDDEQKVAMTTPVFMEPESSINEGRGQMGFVIPHDIPADDVPQPSADGVQIRKRAGGRFAVIRFTGRMDRQSVAKAEKKLRDWINVRKLSAHGGAESAGYDPPWTPGPFRRNEVLIRLQVMDETSPPNVVSGSGSPG